MAARVHRYGNVPRTAFPRKMNENRKENPTHDSDKGGVKTKGAERKRRPSWLTSDVTRLLIDRWRALATRHSN